MLKSNAIAPTPTGLSLKSVYLLLTIAGSIAPWYWLLQDPTALLSPSRFLQLAFANPIATGLATDLLISAAAFFGWVWVELKRLQLSRAWLLLYVGLTFGVGLSCSLPCFLYCREFVLSRAENSASG